MLSTGIVNSLYTKHYVFKQLFDIQMRIFTPLSRPFKVWNYATTIPERISISSYLMAEILFVQLCPRAHVQHSLSQKIFNCGQTVNEEEGKQPEFLLVFDYNFLPNWNSFL